MKKLTEAQKAKIAFEVLSEQSLEVIGKFTVLKISERLANMGGDQFKISLKATFEGKRHECRMVVTINEC